MKKFSITLKGYNQEEVNKFVQKVTFEYERMLDRLKNVELENISLKQELVNISSKNKIQNEADEIIAQAKRNASQIVNDALIRAKKIEEENDKLSKDLNLSLSRLKKLIDEIEKQEY